MSDIKEVNEAYAKVMERNANAAISHSKQTKDELIEKMKFLEGLVVAHHGQIAQLQEKYNLLLTNRFSGGSTAE